MVLVPVHNKKNRKFNAFCAYVFRNRQPVIYHNKKLHAVIHFSNAVSLFCGCGNCRGRIVCSYRVSDTDPRVIPRIVTRQHTLEETAQLEGGLHEVEVTYNILLSSVLLFS